MSDISIEAIADHVVQITRDLCSLEESLKNNPSERSQTCVKIAKLHKKFMRTSEDLARIEAFIEEDDFEWWTKIKQDFEQAWHAVLKPINQDRREAYVYSSN